MTICIDLVGVSSITRRREDIMKWVVDFSVLTRNFVNQNILSVVPSLNSPLVCMDVFTPFPLAADGHV